MSDSFCKELLAQIDAVIDSPKRDEKVSNSSVLEIVAAAINTVAKANRSDYRTLWIILQIVQEIGDSLEADNLYFKRSAFVATCFGYQKSDT